MGVYYSAYVKRSLFLPTPVGALKLIDLFMYLLFSLSYEPSEVKGWV